MTLPTSNQIVERNGLFWHHLVMWCHMAQCNYWNVNYITYQWFTIGLFIFSKCTKNVNIWEYHIWSKYLKNYMYCKFPKHSDTQNICCNHCKISTKWLYHRVMSPNDADGMANSVDPDQTAPSSLIRVYTVCPGISVWKLRIITVVPSLTCNQYNLTHCLGHHTIHLR